VFFEKREHAAGIGTNSVAHSAREPIIHMGEHQIQARIGAAFQINHANPFLLHTARQLGAEIKERAQRNSILARLEQFNGIKPMHAAKFPAHIVVRGREARRVRRAFERFKIDFCQFTPSN
jgi:hypothetical protein